MGSGVDVGIDPKRHPCGSADAPGDFVDTVELRLRFDVETKNIGLERGLDFIGLLTDPGKNDARAVAARLDDPA